uniref:Uncharacterized protein n=1 Tax=Grammatophora oceanica TaxID=210454 RepID=A0A7S1VHZ1_9STRA
MCNCLKRNERWTVTSIQYDHPTIYNKLLQGAKDEKDKKNQCRQHPRGGRQRKARGRVSDSEQRFCNPTKAASKGTTAGVEQQEIELEGLKCKLVLKHNPYYLIQCCRKHIPYRCKMTVRRNGMDSLVSFCRSVEELPLSTALL